MTEKYFAYMMTAVFVLLPAVILVTIRLLIRLRHLQKLARLRLLKRQQKAEKPVFFASEIINEACGRLFIISFTERGHKTENALASLACGKPQKAAEYFAVKIPYLSELLTACIDAGAAYKRLVKHKKSLLADKHYGAYLPALAHTVFDTEAMRSYTSAISPQKLGKCARAYYNYSAAGVYLYDGDMLSASQKASAALEYFRRRKYIYEIAACYLLLGEIYRLSCVNDVAQTMTEAAVKIHKEQNLPQLLAKSTASLGMLMLFENRYEEAEDKLGAALELAPGENLRAYIRNQKALLYIAQSKYKEAQEEISAALKVFEKTKNALGKAFALQLSAHVYFAQKHNAAALKAAEEAAEMYAKQHNLPATLECMYLGADVLFRQNKLKKSEEKLREILKMSEKRRHSFHTADAYSLLGLIYLKRNDLQRAKVLLQQSLHLEQMHRRNEGLVSDYTNLALIDSLSGHKDDAAANLKIALEYAAETGNAGLEGLIKKKAEIIG